MGIEGSGSFNLNQWLGRTSALRVQYRLGGNLEYVYSKRVSWGLSIAPYHIQTFYQYQSGYGLLQLRGQLYEPSLRIYTFLRRGNMAPLGAYQRFSLVAIRNQLTDLDNNLYPDERSFLGIYYDLSLGYGIGYQTIIKDRIVIDARLQAGWPLNLNRYRQTSEVEHFITDAMTVRMRRYLLLNAQVKVGWLLPFRKNRLSQN